MARCGSKPTRTPDRRRARSDDPLVALTRMLDSARRAEALDALVVADGTGCLVAGAGAYGTCEELAALAPLSEGGGPANDTVPCRLDVLRRALRVQRVRIDGFEVLLCARAEHGRTSRGLERAAAGARRILGRARR